LLWEKETGRRAGLKSPILVAVEPDGLCKRSWSSGLSIRSFSSSLRAGNCPNVQNVPHFETPGKKKFPSRVKGWQRAKKKRRGGRRFQIRDAASLRNDQAS
jgi:hypothetical protein